jgi:hypothetical protein
MSALLPLILLTKPLNVVEGANPPFLLGKNMKDKLELLFLITIFVASVAAITPV